MFDEEWIGEYAGRIWVPVLSIKRAKEIFRYIKPVYHLGYKLRYIKGFRNMFTVDFTYFAEPSNRRTDNLEIFCEIITFHKKSGVYNYIRPTLLEILAQIPEKHFGKVVAFEFVGELKDGDELRVIADKFGYRVGKVLLYFNK